MERYNPKEHYQLFYTQVRDITLQVFSHFTEVHNESSPAIRKPAGAWACEAQAMQ